MKRTSRNKSWASATTIQLGVGVVLVVCVILLRGVLGSALWFVVTPLVTHNPLEALRVQLLSKATLANENVQLRSALASTSAALADRNLLRQENSDLKALLGRNITVRQVLAGVVTRPPFTPYDTLMIDTGKAQGVAVGDYVSAGGATIIGEIDEVYSTTARVVLLSAPGESHQALLLETDAHTAIPVVLVGQGGFSMVTEVPSQTGVRMGDPVILPGIADGVMGVVAHVEAKSTESLERLYVQLPVNPLELRFVEVTLQ